MGVKLDIYQASDWIRAG